MPAGLPVTVQTSAWRFASLPMDRQPVSACRAWLCQTLNICARFCWLAWQGARRAAAFCLFKPQPSAQSRCQAKHLNSAQCCTRQAGWLPRRPSRLQHDLSESACACQCLMHLRVIMLTLLQLWVHPVLLQIPLCPGTAVCHPQVSAAALPCLTASCLQGVRAASRGGLGHLR